MKKHLIVIGTVILLLVVGLSITASAGFKCGYCGGDGWYTLGGVEHKCSHCGGDGCVCPGDPAYHDWKDDGSCSCSSGSGDNSIDFEPFFKALGDFAKASGNIMITIGIYILYFALAMFILTFLILIVGGTVQKIKKMKNKEK